MGGETLRPEDGGTQGQRTVLHLLGGTAEDYDEMVAASTGGLDGQWKRWMLDRMHEPRQVLDLACGTGILTFMVLDRFPDAHVTGVDLQPDYLQVAIERARRRELDHRTEFHRSPVEEVNLPAEAYDHVISCYLPKYAERPVLCERLAEWCAPGARVLLHDFAHPTDPKVEAALNRRYEQFLDRVRAEAPHWINCFADLPEVVRDSPWTEDLPAELDRHGFTDVTVEPLAFGCAAVVSARKPD